MRNPHDRYNEFLRLRDDHEQSGEYTYTQNHAFNHLRAIRRPDHDFNRFLCNFQTRCRTNKEFSAYGKARSSELGRIVGGSLKRQTEEASLARPQSIAQPLQAGGNGGGGGWSESESVGYKGPKIKTRGSQEMVDMGEREPLLRTSTLEPVGHRRSTVVLKKEASALVDSFKERRFRNISHRELVRFLTKMDYKVERISGSHYIFGNGMYNVSVPLNDPVAPGTLRNILFNPESGMGIETPDTL